MNNLSIKQSYKMKELDDCNVNKVNPHQATIECNYVKVNKHYQPSNWVLLNLWIILISLLIETHEFIWYLPIDWNLQDLFVCEWTLSILPHLYNYIHPHLDLVKMYKVDLK